MRAGDVGGTDKTDRGGKGVEEEENVDDLNGREKCFVPEVSNGLKKAVSPSALGKSRVERRFLLTASGLDGELVGGED